MINIIQSLIVKYDFVFLLCTNDYFFVTGNRSKISIICDNEFLLEIVRLKSEIHDRKIGSNIDRNEIGENARVITPLGLPRPTPSVRGRLRRTVEDLGRG